MSGGRLHLSAGTCTAGVCGFAYAPQGTPLAAQTPGDCLSRVCDGAGNPWTVNDDSDVFIDGNACTLDVCTSGTPSNPPAPAGTACSQDGGTQCDGAGHCVVVDPTQQLAALRAACLASPGGTIAVSQLVSHVVVTYVVAGSAQERPAFFVQSGTAGPALEIEVDPALLGVDVGTAVSTTVVALVRDAAGCRATAVAGAVIEGVGFPVGWLVQDVSAIASGALVDAYADELVQAIGTILAPFAPTGPTFSEAPFGTVGDPSGRIRLRLPAALAQGLTPGCTLQVAATPLAQEGTTPVVVARRPVETRFLSGCP
jgi:hypothetical protein